MINFANFKYIRDFKIKFLVVLNMVIRYRVGVSLKLACFNFVLLSNYKTMNYLGCYCSLSWEEVDSEPRDSR